MQSISRRGAHNSHSLLAFVALASAHAVVYCQSAGGSSGGLSLDRERSAIKLSSLDQLAESEFARSLSDDLVEDWSKISLYPRATPREREVLEKSIAIQSTNWVVNRYQKGSVLNARLQTFGNDRDISLVFSTTPMLKVGLE